MANKKTGTTTEVKGVNLNRYDDLFKRYAQLYGQDWVLLKSICMKESTIGYNKSVAHGIANPADIEGSKSSDGKSWGVMQFTLPTARDRDQSATVEKLNNVEYSIRLAAQHVAWISLQFSLTDSRRTEWIIKSYNQGVGNTKKEISTGVGYTGDYFPKVAAFYKQFKGA